MELILFVNAAISLALLVVHFADYFAGRSPLSVASRTGSKPVETALGIATPLPELAEEYDRAA
jgi:hypothetical protein